MVVIRKESPLIDFSKGDKNLSKGENFKERNPLPDYCQLIGKGSNKKN